MFLLFPHISSFLIEFSLSVTDEVLRSAVQSTVFWTAYSKTCSRTHTSTAPLNLMAMVDNLFVGDVLNFLRILCK